VRKTVTPTPSAPPFFPDEDGDDDDDDDDDGLGGDGVHSSSTMRSMADLMDDTSCADANFGTRM
jgi:hypothetical protein